MDGMEVFLYQSPVNFSLAFDRLKDKGLVKWFTWVDKPIIVDESFLDNKVLLVSRLLFNGLFDRCKTQTRFFNSDGSIIFRELPSGIFKNTTFGPFSISSLVDKFINCNILTAEDEVISKPLDYKLDEHSTYSITYAFHNDLLLIYEEYSIGPLSGRGLQRQYKKIDHNQWIIALLNENDEWYSVNWMA